ncbi:unnamed protein product [Phaeothamnion confervicola]
MFLDSLSRVVAALAASPAYTGARSAEEIRERILCKASRTTSGSDSYFTVERLVGSDHFLLKPRDDGPQAPIRVEVYLVDNAIHSVVTCANRYGLYDLGEIDDASQSMRLRKPTVWLELDTTVVEKTDYRTNRNVRYLRIEAPEAEAAPQHAIPAGTGERSTAGVGGSGLIRPFGGSPESSSADPHRVVRASAGRDRGTGSAGGGGGGWGNGGNGVGEGLAQFRPMALFGGGGDFARDRDRRVP